MLSFASRFTDLHLIYISLNKLGYIYGPLAPGDQVLLPLALRSEAVNNPSMLKTVLSNPHKIPAAAAVPSYTEF
jgi:hypothetical protein